MNRLKPKDGEDDGACVDGGEGVAGGDDDDVLDAVLGWVVVTAKADDGAESKAKGVKDLGGCADMSAGGKTLSGLHQHSSGPFSYYFCQCQQEEKSDESNHRETLT